MSRWFPLVFSLLLTGTASAQVPLPTQGVVTVVGDIIEVDLVGAAEAPIGERLYTFKAVDIGGREIGVLTGVYRVIRDDWPVIRAIVDPDADADLPGASREDRVSLSAEADASELVIQSDPGDARMTWDGHLLGATGDTLTIAPGTYAFSLEKSGFEATSFDVEVPVGRITSESVALGQSAGGSELYTSAKAQFSACQFDRARDLVSEAISAGLPGEDQNDAFAMFEAMRRIAPVAARAAQAGARQDKICDAGSAMLLFVKAQSTGDQTTMDLACTDMRRALPEDPLVRQTCPR